MLPVSGAWDSEVCWGLPWGWASTPNVLVVVAAFNAARFRNLGFWGLLGIALELSNPSQCTCSGWSIQCCPFQEFGQRFWGLLGIALELSKHLHCVCSCWSVQCCPFQEFGLLRCAGDCPGAEQLKHSILPTFSFEGCVFSYFIALYHHWRIDCTYCTSNWSTQCCQFAVLKTALFLIWYCFFYYWRMRFFQFCRVFFVFC